MNLTKKTLSLFANKDDILKEGEKKGKIDLAKSLLKQGFPEEAILKATSLSYEELGYESPQILKKLNP